MIAITIMLSSDISIDGTTLVWQNVLMRMFFDEISGKGIQEFSYDNRDGDFCSGWKGIMCENGEVDIVSYSHRDFGNFNLHALPPTVTELNITYCKQTFEIQMRRLPRELVRLELAGNHFTGRLDLSQLPTNSQHISFFGNKLTGPIELTNLPRQLTHLDVEKNEIKQPTVLYGNLPESIVRIRLSSNKIQEIRAVDEEMAIIDKALFPGICREYIH